MARYNLARSQCTIYLPNAVLQSQLIDDWKGPFPLPEAIIDYYTYFGPVDVELPGYGNDIFLPSLAELWDFQGGYRWNPVTQEVLDWPDEWLVIAYEGGDPFIFSRTTQKILHAYHGAGDWTPVVLFPNLEVMAACLTTLGGITSIAGDDLTTSEDTIHPRYIEAATQQFHAAGLSSAEVALVLKRLGWSVSE